MSRHPLLSFVRMALLPVVLVWCVLDPTVCWANEPITILEPREAEPLEHLAAKEIRRNPWRLLHRPSEKATRTEDIYDAARAFGEGAGQLNDAIARLQAVSQAKGDPAIDAATLKKFTEGLQTSFEKFRKVEDALWQRLAQ